MKRQNSGSADVYADLHTHTSRSDGQLSPEELVARAADRGIQVLAVTDHDTLAGIQAAAVAAEEKGIHLVSGTEMSVTLGERELHLLAYGFDPAHTGVQEHLAAMQEARQDRAQTIVERLREQGIALGDDQLEAEISAAHAVGRPHVAAALVRAGHVESERAAFEQYLGEGKPGFVAKPAFPASDALDLIHKANGVGVLAHPGHWTSGRQVRQLVDVGLDGLETKHPSHDSSLRSYYERLARSYDLITTGGSDYHGRTESEETHFGTVGMSRGEWERFRETLA